MCAVNCVTQHVNKRHFIENSTDVFILHEYMKEFKHIFHI